MRQGDRNNYRNNGNNTNRDRPREDLNSHSNNTTNSLHIKTRPATEKWHKGSRGGRQDTHLIKIIDQANEPKTIAVVNKIKEGKTNDQLKIHDSNIDNEGHLTTEIRVGSQSVMALIDTGCEATLISEDCYGELKEKDFNGGLIPTIDVLVKGVIGKNTVSVT